MRWVQDKWSDFAFWFKYEEGGAIILSWLMAIGLLGVMAAFIGFIGCRSPKPDPWQFACGEWTRVRDRLRLDIVCSHEREAFITRGEIETTGKWEFKNGAVIATFPGEPSIVLRYLGSSRDEISHVLAESLETPVGDSWISVVPPPDEDDGPY